MRKVALLCFGCLVTVGAYADIESFSVSKDDKSLTYRSSAGHDRTQILIKDQVGFSQAQISRDRKHIGWVATFYTCCTSYAVPLELVVSSESGSLSAFAGGQGIFKWCFVPELDAVVFRQAALHGPAVETYTLGRIKDGKELETYVAPPVAPEKPAVTSELPKWANCASGQ